MAFVDTMLVVTNTAYRADDWGPGSIAVFAADTGALLNRIPTSRPNPQRVLRVGDRLLVLNTGRLNVGGFEIPTAREDGSLDVFAVGTLATATGPDAVLPLPRGAVPGLGAPVDLAVVGDRALVTLGTANAALLLDLNSLERLRGADDPIWLGEAAWSPGLGSVAAWGERFVVADFNRDRLYMVEPDGEVWPCAVAVGRARHAVEGAQSVVVRGDTAWVLLALAGAVREVDLSAWSPEDCRAVPVRDRVAATGAVPNDLAWHDGQLFVVHSGENNVVAFDADSGRAVRRWILPPGSNPWHVAVDPVGGRLAVSEWAANGLSLYPLAGGPPRWRVGPEDAAVPPAPPDRAGRGDARHADVVVDAPGAGDRPFRDPVAAVNGVRGAGALAGSFDVFSLAAELDDPAASVVLRWSERRVVDGPGPDLVVFENPFLDAGQGDRYFLDPVVVEVSRDGARWVAWPHAHAGPDPEVFSGDPSHWPGFAGLRPVHLHEERAPLDPFSEAAGGDAFDLADLPADDPESARIRAEGFAFVRLTSASARRNPGTGHAFPRHPVSDGADIDGVYARRFAPDATPR